MDRSILTAPAPEPDRTLRYGAGPDHVADAWLPAREGRPLVVLIHGGFWRAEHDRKHTRRMAAALRDAGWPVASLEYRREAGRPDVYTADIRLALTEVPPLMAQALGWRPAPIVLAGHSAGGHLALWAAATCPPPGLGGVLALAPVADLAAADAAGLGKGAVTDFLGGSARTRPDLDPRSLPRVSVPVVLVHGAADPVVPLEQSKSYLRSHPAARLTTVPGTGHFELIDPATGAWPHVVAELASFGG
jgi:pimeloyl-ACP methyl ester carboxylesterase